MSTRRATHIFLAMMMMAAAAAAAAAAPAARSPTETQERLEVVELEIEGARAVRESDLRALLETRKSPRAPWRDKAYLDPAVISTPT